MALFFTVTVKVKTPKQNGGFSQQGSQLYTLIRKKKKSRVKSAEVSIE